MPVPKPRKGESQSDFMGRCMHEVSKNSDRPQEQNVAICLSTWRDSKKKSLKSPALYRAAQIDNGAIDTDKRVVSFSFSSRTPVRRRIGALSFREVLSHDPGAMVTDRLDRGVVPLLENHNWDRQIGIVRAYAVQDGKGIATAELSPNPNGQEAMRDIAAGIKTAISVGYIPHQMRCIRRRNTDVTDNPELQRFSSDDDPDDDIDPDDLFNGDDDDDENGDDDDDLYEVSRWEPIEVSLVSVPADPSVGIGREQQELYSVRVLGMRDEVAPADEVNLQRANTIMSDIPVTNLTGTTVIAPSVKIEKEDLGSIREAELVRIREIQGYGSQFKALEEAAEYIRSGKTVAEFQTFILREKAKQNAPVTTVTEPSLGFGPRDRNRYSITRAIRNKWRAQEGTGRFDGFEAEVSQEIARMQHQDPLGFFMPDWALFSETRDLTATPPTGSGGLTIQTTVEPSLIPLLRNRTAVLQAGARYMSGLQGNLQMPRQYAPSTISWNTEIAAVTESDLSMDAVTLSPNRVGGWCNYSKQLLAQSSLDIDNVVRDDMVQVIQIAIDSVAITGTGTNQPTGILNVVANAPGTPGPSYAYSKTAPAITFPSGYPTWTNIVTFESNIEAGNQILDESGCYLTTPAVKGAWKTYAKADPRSTTLYYPSFFWEGALDGTVNGRRAIATNQVPGNKVIFGKWNELMIGQWAGLDIVVDIYSLATQAEIRIITNMFCDVKYRYASAFCCSTNSGVSN